VTQRDAGLPIEDFIHALTSQLDRAQSALALKAKLGLPLTFAVKDLTLELRTHVEMVGSAVRIRPAGPGDGEASILHLSLTTITRPLMEENTRQLEVDPDEPSLRDVLPDATEDERRRLEWAGIQSVSQLQELHRLQGEEVVERVAQIPVLRLRTALERASRPQISRILPERLDDVAGSNGATLLRIRGRNLVQDGAPRVRIGGEPVPVLRASPKEVVIAPLPHQLSGSLALEPAPGSSAQAEFDCRPPAAAEPDEAAAPGGSP
jgi:hypothetical protein